MCAITSRISTPGRGVLSGLMAEGRSIARCPNRKAGLGTSRGIRGSHVVYGLAAIASVALAASLTSPPRPLLVWNASASAPEGLYQVGSSRGARVGDTVMAWSPADARRLAAERHYLPANVPLVKRIAAAGGDLVCAGVARYRQWPAGRASPQDRWSRPGNAVVDRLPVPRGGRDFPSAGRSRFDGRYFGITRKAEIVGRGKAAVGALKIVLAAAALLLSGRAEAQGADRWSAYIAEASARFGVPEDWVGRVIEAESGGRTTLAGRPITSHAGAMGLMQLMPATWAEMRERHRLGPDPHDPRDNVLAGTAYLRAMYERFGPLPVRGLQCRTGPLCPSSRDRATVAGRDDRLDGRSCPPSGAGIHRAE